MEPLLEEPLLEELLLVLVLLEEVVELEDDSLAGVEEDGVLEELEELSEEFDEPRESLR